MTDYTEEIIKGKIISKILPKGWGLVLEGGGTRGFYSAGVFDAFIEADIMFPYIIGVSAGAANAFSYVSGQFGRSRQIVHKYVSNHQYLSYRNLLLHGTYFGYDYVFKTIPNEHIFWDKDVFYENKTNLLTGATDCVTGEAVWFEKEEFKESPDMLIASCSVPFASKIVNYKGSELLDGGIASPIPIDKSMDDGNTFHVIVLTRNEGYKKRAFKNKRLLKFFYRKYPKLIETMTKRDEIYNKQLSICEKLEKDGKAIIIRPKIKLEVGRATKDSKKLLALYDEGYEEGKEALKEIVKALDRRNEEI